MSTPTKLRFTVWTTWREAVPDGRHPDGRRPTQTYATPHVTDDRQRALDTHRRLTAGRWVRPTMINPTVTAIYAEKLEQAAGNESLWTVVSTWDLADRVELDSPTAPPTPPPTLFDDPPDGAVGAWLDDRQDDAAAGEVDQLLEQLAAKIDNPQLTAHAMETADMLLSTGIPRAARAYAASMLADPSRLGHTTARQEALR